MQFCHIRSRRKCISARCGYILMWSSCVVMSNSSECFVKPEGLFTLSGTDAMWKRNCQQELRLVYTERQRQRYNIVSGKTKIKILNKQWSHFKIGSNPLATCPFYGITALKSDAQCKWVIRRNRFRVRFHSVCVYLKDTWYVEYRESACCGYKSSHVVILTDHEEN